MAVVIETTIGDLTVDLFIEERPRACLNFMKLCKLKYYNFNLFHNIEHGFIAQTGDPTGAGDGGESVWGLVEGSHKKYFEAESLPKIKHSMPGLLSMVGIGKNMVGSQFFFTLGPDLVSLDGVHCVIGEVTEGHDVLRKLNEAIVDEQFRPYQDIRITHTVVLEDPFDDPRGFQIPSRSPSPSAKRLQNGRIGADEDIDDTEGKTAQEIQEMLAEREAKARATILEIVGDLPDAEIAPPENVLFVCKLNPVTTDDDLEIIFSRFGKVKGCEVIRDRVTGDSLQYAFVEFEDKKACENAYFKMDNVLIDDRRIHVDFSQSVAKVQWRGKGRGVVHADGKGGRLDFNHLRAAKDEKQRRRTPEKKDKDSRNVVKRRRDYCSDPMLDRSRSKSRDSQSNESMQQSFRHRSPLQRFRDRDQQPYRINRDRNYRQHNRFDSSSRLYDRRDNNRQISYKYNRSQRSQSRSTNRKDRSPDRRNETGRRRFEDGKSRERLQSDAVIKGKEHKNRGKDARSSDKARSLSQKTKKKKQRSKSSTDGHRNNAKQKKKESSVSSSSSEDSDSDSSSSSTSTSTSLSSSRVEEKCRIKKFSSKKKSNKKQKRYSSSSSSESSSSG